MVAKKTARVGNDCVACGNCLKYCAFTAVSVYKGLYATIDENKCKGCGKCIQACPAAVITFTTEEGTLA